MPRHPAAAREPEGGGLALDGIAFSVLLLLGALALQTCSAVAGPALQTFGPGQVNCQALTGTQVDCLLAASRVTQGNRNVATFSVTTLPLGEQALFRKWCVAAANECTVTVTGQRASPQSTRLAAVMKVHWTRLTAPMDQAAARAAGKASTNAIGAATRPAR